MCLRIVNLLKTVEFMYLHYDSIPAGPHVYKAAAAMT